MYLFFSCAQGQFVTSPQKGERNGAALPSVFSMKSMATTSSSFENFLTLFTVIERQDTVPTLIIPFEADYGCPIDSSYYCHFETVPYFLFSSAFRIDFPNGYLLSIVYEYGNDFTDLYFLRLIEYNLDGSIRNTVTLPCFYAYGATFDRSYYLVSSKDIYCISKFKKMEDTLVCEGLHFSINYDKSCLVLDEDHQFVLRNVVGIE